jgi:uncharacterized membrane protein YvbJ
MKIINTLFVAMAVILMVCFYFFLKNQEKKSKQFNPPISSECQEALKIDPLSASKIDPPFDQYKG